uniref:Uncharacterized protein n=1 Tax=Peronospora matthiolae TaxID=2874970 RepID=A0AAV1T2F2_9STRA
MQRCVAAAIVLRSEWPAALLDVDTILSLAPLIAPDLDRVTASKDAEEAADDLHSMLLLLLDQLYAIFQSMLRV